MIQLLKYLSALCLISPVAFSATGDIIDYTISKDGWRIRLIIEGFTTGATTNPTAFTGAFNTSPNASTPYLTVTSWGYTGTIPVAKIRTVYLCPQMRFPFNTRAIPGGPWTSTFVRDEQVVSNFSSITGRFVGTTSSGPNLYLTALSGVPTGSDVLWTGDISSASFTASGIGAFVLPEAIPPASKGSPDQRLDGSGNLVMEFPLSDYVYQRDDTGALPNVGTAPTLTVPDDFITSGANTSNALTNVSVTNNSDVPYRTVKFWWLWPDYQRFTNQAYPKAFAFAPHGSGGKPGIECVVFRISDGATTVPSPTPVMLLEKDHMMPETESCKACVPTFIDILSIPSNFVQGAVCSMDAIAYPQIGDAPYNTATNVLQPESLYGTQTFVCDRTGGYGSAFAVVSPSGTDPLAGNDSGKLVGNVANFSTATGTDYATITRAARAILNYNINTYARNDVGAGIIYLRAGNYAGLGTPFGPYGNVPQTWLTIQPYPGVGRSAVFINSKAGDSDISDRIKFNNITFSSVTNSTLDGVGQLWFDQTEFNSISGGPIYGANTVAYLTHCKLTKYFAGFRAAIQPTNFLYALIRGCEFSGFDRDIHVGGAVVGNYQSTKYPANQRFVERHQFYTGPDGTPLFAFNNILGWQGVNALCFKFSALSETDNLGYTVLQNIIECTELVAPGVGDIGAAENVANYPVNNCDISNNIWIGQRMQFAYNSDERVHKPRYFWEVRNNFWDVLGFKVDNYEQFGGSGIRQGSWSMFFGVGMKSNISIENDLITTGFPPYFIGLNGLSVADGTGGVYDSAWAKFRARKAADTSTTSNVGLGDYTLQPDSPMRNVQTNESYILPFDMGGHRRRAVDAAGVHSQHRNIGRHMF